MRKPRFERRTPLTIEIKAQVREDPAAVPDSQLQLAHENNAQLLAEADTVDA